MKAIIDYFINASITDVVIGIIFAALVIRMVLDILFGDSFFGISIHRREKK